MRAQSRNPRSQSPQRSPPSRSRSPPAPPSSPRRRPWRRRTRPSRRTRDPITARALRPGEARAEIRRRTDEISGECPMWVRPRAATVPQAVPTSSRRLDVHIHDESGRRHRRARAGCARDRARTAAHVAVRPWLLHRTIRTWDSRAPATRPADRWISSSPDHLEPRAGFTTYADAAGALTGSTFVDVRRAAARRRTRTVRRSSSRRTTGRESRPISSRRSRSSESSQFTFTRWEGYSPWPLRPW